MKTAEEMTQSVLQRRDAYNARRRRQKQLFVKAGLPALCLALVLGAATAAGLARRSAWGGDPSLPAVTATAPSPADSASHFADNENDSATSSKAASTPAASSKAADKPASTPSSKPKTSSKTPEKPASQAKPNGGAASGSGRPTGSAQTSPNSSPFPPKQPLYPEVDDIPFGNKQSETSSDNSYPSMGLPSANYDPMFTSFDELEDFYLNGATPYNLSVHDYGNDHALYQRTAEHYNELWQALWDNASQAMLNGYYYRPSAAVWEEMQLEIKLQKYYWGTSVWFYKDTREGGLKIKLYPNCAASRVREDWEEAKQFSECLSRITVNGVTLEMYNDPYQNQVPPIRTSYVVYWQQDDIYCEGWFDCFSSLEEAKAFLPKMVLEKAPLKK